MKEIKEADEKTLMCVMGCMTTTDGPALPVEALKKTRINRPREQATPAHEGSRADRVPPEAIRR